MARVTVEDCLAFVDNRFDLVVKAAERAHALELGAVDPLVELENDKPTVLALREIAAGFNISCMEGTEKRANTEVKKEKSKLNFTEDDATSEA